MCGFGWAGRVLGSAQLGKAHIMLPHWLLPKPLIALCFLQTNRGAWETPGCQKQPGNNPHISDSSVTPKGLWLQLRRMQPEGRVLLREHFVERAALPCLMHCLTLSLSVVWPAAAAHQPEGGAL